MGKLKNIAHLIFKSLLVLIEVKTALGEDEPVLLVGRQHLRRLDLRLLKMRMMVIMIVSMVIMRKYRMTVVYINFDLQVALHVDQVDSVVLHDDHLLQRQPVLVLVLVLVPLLVSRTIVKVPAAVAAPHHLHYHL